MANPARDLVKIFEAWSASSEPPAVVRGFGGGETEPALAHMGAMTLVASCYAALDDLERRGVQETSVYREAGTAWILAILSYPNGWGSGNAASQMQAARIDMLRGLALLLDGMPVQVNEAQAASLGKYLDELVSLLAQDTALDDALRRYIHDLIAEVRRALGDYEVTGKFDAERAATNLWVALQAARAQSKKFKTRWRQAADVLHTPVAAGLLANLPTLAIEAIQIIGQ